MDWKIVQINKETDHKFLNFYTATYEVEKEEGKKETTYFFFSINLRLLYTSSFNLKKFNN